MKGKLKYERPILIKVNRMTFPTEIIETSGRWVVCKQCSSCHACR